MKIPNCGFGETLMPSEHRNTGGARATRRSVSSKDDVNTSVLCANADAAGSNYHGVFGRKTKTFRFCVILIALGVQVNCIATAETAQKAESFVESVGINIHLDYADSAYSLRFPEVRAALRDLHVRHLREGLVLSPRDGYYAHLNELAGLGMRSILITEPRVSEEAMSEFRARVPNFVEGYEAPNELDMSKDPQWDETLRKYLPVLYKAAASQGLPVIGPSLVKRESYATLGDVSSLITVANLHNYPGGRNPGTRGWGANGYGSLPYHQRNVRQYAGELPIVTTETGYTNDQNVANSVPEAIAAVYFPRLLLFQFLSGIKRTYIYELLSSGKEDYGLMTRNCARKPAFGAVQSLMEMLDDRDKRSNADDLSYELTSDSHDMQHLLFQKSDGRFFLALWIEAPSYDVNAKRNVVVDLHGVTLRLPWVPGSVKLHRWTASGEVKTTELATGKTITLPVGDCLSVLELAPSEATHSEVSEITGEITR